MTTRKRLAAATAALAITALAGGVAAQFTTSTTSAPQKIGTGTLALSLDNVAPTVWTDDISNLAAGDSIERFVDLRNSGSLDFSSLSLVQTNTLGDLLVAPSDINVMFEGCSVAWNATNGTCAGVKSAVLYPSSVTAWGAASKDLTGFSSFKSGDIKHLKLTTTLVSAATNAVQGKRGTITYTFGGTQRAATVFSDSQVAPVAPVVPSMGAGDIDSGSVDIKLPSDPTATSYDLRYSSDSGATWVPVEDISPDSSTYTLTGLSASTRYIYQLRVNTASGTSPWSGSLAFTTSAEDAPVVVGTNYFYDSFSTVYSDLNGKATQDGSSTWQVWSGGLKTTSDGFVKAASNVRTVGVVRTSSNSGSLYAGDLDGFEAVIVRGTSPGNYIYVGGNGTAKNLSIIKVENGVETVLAAGTLADSSNARIVVQNNTISVYKVTNSSTSINGLNPVLSATSDFNANDPGASFFGVGFNKSFTGGYGVPDFTFDAL